MPATTNTRKSRAVSLAVFALLSTVLALVVAPVGAQAEGLTDRVVTWTQEERDENLAHAKIGVQLGVTSEAEVAKAYPEAQAESFQSIADTILALGAGKLDYATAPEPIALLYMRKNSNLTYVKPALYGCDVSVGVAKGKDELREKLNQAFAKLQQDGTIDAVRKKWCEDGNYDMSDIPVREDGEVLTVAYSPTDEPSSFLFEGHAAGTDAEMIMRAAYEIGMRVEFQDMNFTAKLAALTAGTVDAGIYMVNTPERAKSIDFTNTVYSLDWVAMTTVDADASDSIFDVFATGFTSTFITEKRWAMVVEGLFVTVGIALGSFALGTVGGGLLCFMKRCGKRVPAAVARVYCDIVTGIPVLVWLMILYYIVFASVGVPAPVVAIICFGLEAAAPLSSIFSTGIEAVSRGEIEAAEAMGFPLPRVYRHIVLPQALQRIGKLYAGQLTALIKATSVVGYVAITDLTKVSDIIRSRTFDAFFPLISVAVVYFVVILVFSLVLTRIIRGADPHRRRPERVLTGITAR